MTECAVCGGSLPPLDPRPALRGPDRVVHVACAPAPLIDSAYEEYHAIVRKGIRYFVEKYGASEVAPAEVGAVFLEIGRSLDDERTRRARPR